MIKGLKDSITEYLQNESKNQNNYFNHITRLTCPGIILYHIIPYYGNINKKEFNFLSNDLANLDTKMFFTCCKEELRLFYIPEAQYFFNNKKLFAPLFYGFLENNYFFMYILKIIYKFNGYLDLYDFLTLMHTNKSHTSNLRNKIKENINFIINLFSEDEINHLKIINFELKLKGETNPFLNEVFKIINGGEN